MRDLLKVLPTRYLKVPTPKKDRWVFERPIAHRGLHFKKDIPENSIASFKNAIDKNYPIEIDIHVLKCGNVIVFHDFDLKRMCNDNRLIEECTYEEIKDLCLYDTDQKIPLLQDVLKTVNGDVPLLIEIKCLEHNGVVEEKTHNLLKDYKGDFAIQSFNPLTLKWFREKESDWNLGLLSGSFDDAELPLYKKFLLKNLWPTPIVRPNFIAYEFSEIENNPGLFITKKFYNLPVLAWTIRNQEQYTRIKNKVDNIIFENIEP